MVVDHLTAKEMSVKNVIKPLWVILLAIAYIFAGCSSSKNTTEFEKTELKDIVGNKSFKFVAERTEPLRLKPRYLTSAYDVTVNNDSLICYLPYFGRAYQAPINPTEGGIQFTSTQFSYLAEPGRKDSWTVSIKPGDQRDVQQLYFTFFNNGTATLNVTLTQKDAISFSGRIEKLKEN